ncbi:MAG: hypothetical protein FWH37_03610 [Candidatus Bathyarchaeota archaeon]|nr:hypothetical protein [Candidatus Termiticorpusculum sp.]
MKYLLDQKADDLLSKLTFAQQAINRIESPDEILSSYTMPLQNLIGSLRNRVEQAKAEFTQFVQATHFNQLCPIQGNAQRKLLAAILRNYEDIENRIIIGIDTFLPLIPVWNNQKQNPETKLYHNLLKIFVSDILKLGQMDDYVMTIVGENYACLPINWAESKHVIFGTYSEMENLQKSVLLSHEIGHIFYNKNEQNIVPNVTSNVLNKLHQNKPPNVNQNDFEQAKFIWASNWIPEFISDCFAVRLMGPAFLLQFMLIVLNGQPNRISVTHPPSNLRVKFMIDTLQSLNLPNCNISHYQALWDSYSNTVSTPISIFLVDDEVIKVAFDSINSMNILPTCINEKWVDILEAKKAIKTNVVPVQDLVSIICALGMEEVSRDLSLINQVLLERYVSNFNVF